MRVLNSVIVGKIRFRSNITYMLCLYLERRIINHHCTAMRDQRQNNDNKVGPTTRTELLHYFCQPSGQRIVQQARTCDAYHT